MKLSTAILISAMSLPVQASDWTGDDKVLHAKYGAGIGSMATLVSNFASYDNPVLIGGLAATLAGLGKEIKDEIDYGGFDGKDLIVTSLSGFAASWLTNEFMNLESMPVSVEFTPVDDGFYFGVRSRF